MFADPQWAVNVGGEYLETDLVTVYRIDMPEQQVAYYAQYIANGEFPE